MKPALGISLELLTLALSLGLAPFIPSGLLFGLYVVCAQLLASYLLHCPAHFIVGSALGIKFSGVHLGRTTISKSISPRLGRVARLMPVPYLSTEAASVASASPRRAAAMYASGVSASVSSALLIAAAATSSEPLAYAAIAWGVAVAYLASDLVLSPKSGDLRRARLAMRRHPAS
jgi:hypothetical protein